MFAAALRLGLTSFGGPTAHIGYFREDYVDKDPAFGSFNLVCKKGPDGKLVWKPVTSVKKHFPP